MRLKSYHDSPTTEQPPPLFRLLGAFRSLGLEGIDDHDFIDYLFVRTNVMKLLDLTPEIFEKYEKILNDMQDKEKNKNGVSKVFD